MLQSQGADIEQYVKNFEKFTPTKRPPQHLLRCRRLHHRLTCAPLYCNESRGITCTRCPGAGATPAIATTTMNKCALSTVITSGRLMGGIMHVILLAAATR